LFSSQRPKSAHLIKIVKTLSVVVRRFLYDAMSSHPSQDDQPRDSTTTLLGGGLVIDDSPVAETDDERRRRINPYLWKNNNNMGIQSQLREGSIRAAKKRGSTMKALKFKQKAVPGGTIFVPWKHFCAAEHLKNMGKDVNIPKCPHHDRCPRNRKTRGISAATVAFNKAVKINLAVKRASLDSVLGRRLNAMTLSVAAVATMLQVPYPQLNPRPSVARPTGGDGTAAAAAASTNNNGEIPVSSTDTAAVSLREKLDERMKQEETLQARPPWLADSKYPVALMCAISCITSYFEHKKSSKTQEPLPKTERFVQAISRYYEYFPPATCTFTFPRPDIVKGSNSTPSPEYHSILHRW
jgi:hypothetical protein